ncbi:hypothetical protein EPUS_07187 [Endocarpon pusillum Z07020]|uniref:Uncharacterized protein n=1 Tax=Endocarpon pusillum (strain Z07020 / HMAS-L-300199) TaxID=1263415 RepID=U1GAE0_ENDPU|nr:uncharacterized protein EPUS_07187 [Endocarpon pusillum Z07020]ERF68626.1 hypothetical protein EPUS_07187 [Endocarpon pusillum Z07020]
MKRSLVIAVLLFTLLPGCTFLGWWLARKFFQEEFDRYDRGRLVADILNARAAAAPNGGGGAGGNGGGGEGGNGAAAAAAPPAPAPEPAPEPEPAPPPAAA